MVRTESGGLSGECKMAVWGLTECARRKVCARRWRGVAHRDGSMCRMSTLAERMPPPACILRTLRTTWPRRSSEKSRSESAEEKFLPIHGCRVLCFQSAHGPNFCFMNRPVRGSRASAPTQPANTVHERPLSDRCPANCNGSPTAPRQVAQPGDPPFARTADTSGHSIDVRPHRCVNGQADN